MDLDPFVEQLGGDLTAAAEAGGPDLQSAAGLLAAAADPAVRLLLLDVLAAAADELTSSGDVVVEVRLRGRDVQLVANAAPAPVADPAPAAPTAAPVDDGDDSTARVSLRLPESLKGDAERAAAVDGVSLNTWLVRAIAAATGTAARPSSGRGNRLTGWARS